MSPLRKSVSAIIDDNHFVLVLLCLFHSTQNKAPQFVLLGTSSPDKRVQFNILGDDVKSFDAATVLKLLRPDPHGQPHYKKASHGDAVHASMFETFVVTLFTFISRSWVTWTSSPLFQTASTSIFQWRF